MLVIKNRRSGKDRRQGERRRYPSDAAQIPSGLDRRSGTDRRQRARRATDDPGLIPEQYDYQWRNRWP